MRGNRGQEGVTKYPEEEEEGEGGGGGGGGGGMFTVEVGRV